MILSRDTLVFLLLLFFFCSSLPADSADSTFDVRQHLSTVSRYGASKETTVGSYVPSTIPEGCSPIHLNLVSRHGTRSPTKKRIKELDQLSIRLEELVNHAKQAEKTILHKIPSWLFGWQSPWKGRLKGGELISKGEDELYHLALRIRKRFPELFNEEYHPDIFSIRATQVPRASASAVAFGIGLFQGNGTLGPAMHRAFSVTSESRASDVCLRFFDSCGTYKIVASLWKEMAVALREKNDMFLSQEYRKSQEPAVDKLKEPILEEITAALVQRYQLNFTRQDVASVWFLCKQEASLLDIVDQACGLFTASEVELLEWTDDLELFLLKGYGKSINYHMGLPLLQDVVQSMEQAILAKEENYKTGTFEKARLRFAHAETVVPFTCLLGIFLGGSEFELVQRDEPLSLPPKPPQPRNWRGSTVAPFGVNNMLVLYQCPDNVSHSTTASKGYKSKYYVQVMHNEIPVPMPGCDNMDFCSFEVFKESIANPHLKHNFESVCTVQAKEELPSPQACSIATKLLNFIRRFLRRGSQDNTKFNQKNEL